MNARDAITEAETIVQESADRREGATEFLTTVDPRSFCAGFFAARPSNCHRCQILVCGADGVYSQGAALVAGCGRCGGGIVVCYGSGREHCLSCHRDG